MQDLLEWRKEWDMDIPEMDSEHRELMNLLNQLVRVLRQPASLSEERDALMERLFVRAREHFEAEEAMMEAVAFPDLAEHRREHRMLRAELRQLISEIKSGGMLVDHHLLRALRYWLIDHVVVEDKAFAEHYHNQEGKQQA